MFKEFASPVCGAHSRYEVGSPSGRLKERFFIYFQDAGGAGKQILDQATSQVTSLSDALNLLQDPSDGNFVIIAGRKVEKNKAYENIKFAVVYAERHFNVSKDEIFFKSLPGKVVGESRESGAFIDPVTLMHPAERLTNVLLHELGHDKNEIQNEGLVEAYAEAIGLKENGTTTEKYQIAVAKFNEFVKQYPGTVEDIYKLYYAGKYEEIYMNFGGDKGKPDEIEVKHLLFTEVFPELDYGEKGHEGDMYPITPKGWREKKGDLDVAGDVQGSVQKALKS